MTKILFLPFSVIGGFIPGKIATTAFERLWRVGDDQESPDPEHQGARWPKLIVALAIEGTIFRAVRGAVDRGARELFVGSPEAGPAKTHPSPPDRRRPTPTRALN